MTKTAIKGAALAGALFAAGTGALAQDAQVQALADLYGALPATSLPDISPDGRHLARRVVHKGRYVLRIEATGNPKDAVLWAPTDGASLEDFDWTGDGNLLVQTSVLGATAKYSVDPQSSRRTRYVDIFDVKRPQVLTPRGKTVAKMTFRKLGQIDVFQPLADPELVSGELPVFVTTENASRYGETFGPARVRLDKNKYAFDDRPVKGSGVYSYIGDRTGTVVLATRRRFGETAEARYLRVDGTWREIDAKPLAGFDVRAVEDADTLIVSGGTPAGLHRFDVGSMAVRETLYEGSQDAYPLFAPSDGSLVAVVPGGTASGVRFVSEAEQAAHDGIEAAIGMGPLFPLDADHSGRFAVYSAAPSGGPTAYVIWDNQSGAVVRTLSAYPEIAERPRTSVRPVSYTARDGLVIEGFYTTTDEEAGDAPRPLVVLPHGGPASRDTAGFDYLRDYLASLGYAVFQPNFRGSTGYGASFQRAGYREWGAKMQTDIVDGVAALIEAGDADPDRLAIMGWSYGGYAALMGTLDETPYRCAVSINGVTDLAGMLDIEQTGGGFDYWAAHIGRDFGDAALASRSPLRRAEEIDIPVLLIHGGLDKIVRKGQSAALEAAMKAADKDVRAVYLMESNHHLVREEDRQRALAEAGAFLTACLPPAV